VRIDPRLREEVRRRANFRCEYCLFPNAFAELRFQVDHIVARQHGGETVLDNLAFCCPHCNKFKGPNLSAIDPATGQTVRVFNPRSDEWAKHFEWSGARIIGLTLIGRATENLLKFNRSDRVLVRETLIAEGVYFSNAEL
jgi:hypothetical protein